MTNAKGFAGVHFLPHTLPPKSRTNATYDEHIFSDELS